MCQLAVVLEQDGESKPIMESVTALEVTTEGIIVSTFFEEPLTVRDVKIQRIDFIGGSVVLVPLDK